MNEDDEAYMKGSSPLRNFGPQDSRRQPRSSDQPKGNPYPRSERISNFKDTMREPDNRPPPMNNSVKDMMKQAKRIHEEAARDRAMSPKSSDEPSFHN